MQNLKIIHSIVFLLFLSLSLSGQEEEQPAFEDNTVYDEEVVVKEKYPKNKDGVYRNVEEMPRFPNSDCEAMISNSKYSLSDNKILRKNCAVESFLAYVKNNLKYPSKETDISMMGGYIVVYFTIAKDGTLKNISTQQGIGGVRLNGSDEVEAVVQKMNDENIRWIPGKHKGEVVEVIWSIPINLKRT